MRKVTVAATQMSCSNNPEQNIANAEKLIRMAKEKGAQIIQIQELFENLYFAQNEDPKNFKLAKQEDNNPMLNHMCKLAKELDVVLPISFFEKSNQVYYNTVLVIDADGSRLGIYRKTHIPDDPGYYEKYYFSPGDTGFKVWNTKYAKIGVGICWDQWFPEAARSMVLKGAEILLYPTAIGTAALPPAQLDEDHTDYLYWQNTMLGHSAANVIPVLASNRIGTEYIGDTAINFWGKSFISDTTGQILQEADNKTETVIIQDFDLDAISELRAEYCFLRDRRPEMYETLFTLDGVIR